ncbi:hypothetical protein, partial [Burkholderia sp. Bp8998]|uniref:hypothetical protein n=1 Tax=Burkholderia sp. Bp8998 TaxID=2184557 RepID=UPI000FB28581
MTAIVKQGITEEYWGLMSEDRKLGWELFTRMLAIVLALFVTKTGVTAIDWAIGADLSVISWARHIMRCKSHGYADEEEK